MSEEKKLTDDETFIWLLEGSKWKAYNLQEVPDLIRRLQSENKTLKTELRKECEEHEEFTVKAKAEIERLEKDVHDMSWIIKIHKYCVGADHCQNSSMKEFKLQKQVDELTEERENMQAVIFGLEEDKRQLLKRLDEEFVSLKAVKAAGISPKAMKMLVESVGCVQKDTAKEILCELLDIEVKDEDYKMFFLDVCDKLEKFAQKYGVEVE